MPTLQLGPRTRYVLVSSTSAIKKKSVVDMVGPVGFEPTTSAESFVYGYLHAILNFVLPPTGGQRTSCYIFWSPSSFLSRTDLLDGVCQDCAPSTDLKARSPTERPGLTLPEYRYLNHM